MRTRAQEFVNYFVSCCPPALACLLQAHYRYTFGHVFLSLLTEFRQCARTYELAATDDR